MRLRIRDNGRVNDRPVIVDFEKKDFILLCANGPGGCGIGIPECFVVHGKAHRLL